VKLGIARARGIAANLDVTLLTRFASSLAPEGVRVADAESLEARVLGLLLDEEFLARPELAPVRTYLRAAGDAADAIDLRRVQLASRLGRIFEEYTYSRADMLASWKSGPSLDAAHAETERWQRAMALAIFGDGRNAATEVERLVPLGAVTASLAPTPQAPSRPLHVFGFAHVARSFYDLLERLARMGDVVVYSLSPCQGFWEDVDEDDPAPLHLWGRAGRDHVRVLDALTGFDHEDRCIDPLESGSPTLLHTLQSDLLRRAAPLDDRGPLADGSVIVTEHASIRREMEAVASSIWALLEKDETLRFDDFAVLVPPEEASRYAAHLPMVFREAHDIPYQTMGIAPPAPTSVREAIDLLLALPLGRFSRADLLRLLVHPSVVAAFPDVDPQRWTAWCDALGIVHGADRTDHEGTYIDRDILNWDQGLRRLALGAFMVGDAGGTVREDGPSRVTPFVLGTEAYAPFAVTTAELRDAAAFGVLARSLIEDARFARTQQMPAAEWAEYLATMVSTYVTPVGSEEAEELTRHLRRIHRVGEADLSGHRVGYRVAYELATRRLGSGPSGSGSEGVVVSTIASLRAIPCRVVYACGMGEGRFPSADTEDPLDLRWARRRDGDVSARDRDKYAFLELLLGARDQLTLSYVSRDALTGDPLAPSSVVQELLHTLSRGYVSDVAAIRRRHPLRRWDPDYHPRIFGGESALERVALPEATAEAKTLALRRAMQTEHPDVHEVRARAEANEPGWQKLAEHLRLAPMPRPPAQVESKVVVPMHALVKFLEFPLHGWAKFRFGLGELEDEDVLARDSEPFETELREETLFLRGVLMAAKRRGVPLEQAYDEAVRDRELRGAGPSGAFARGERRDHVETLRTWRSELAQHDVAFESLGVHRFGRGGEHAESDEVHPAVSFDLDVLEAGTKRVLRAEIIGRTLPLASREGASVTFAKRGDDADDDWSRATRRRTLLRSLVDHAVLCASEGGTAERTPAMTALIVVATSDGANTERIRLPRWTRDKAVVWLRGLVRDLLEGKHDYFLPYEAAFVHRERSEDGPIAPVLEEARDKLRDGRQPLALRSAYGPVPRPQEYPIPDEEAARAKVAHRFGPLFEGWDS
jgi:exodeoxyribonuclease V gamma subunit